MQDSVRTVYSAYLQTCQYLQIPPVIKPYSTLNEKFSIHETVAVADGDVLGLNYACIGNGGHRFAIGTNNVFKPEIVQHRPNDAALYSHLPFVLRLPAQDLTAAERSNYRLRRVETHDGVSYIAYYAKVLDKSSTIPQMELRSVTDGVVTSTPFIPSVANLNPTPPAINSSGVLTPTGDYVAATGKVPFILDANDIAELLNVCNIIYGDPNYAIVSEIALCTGVDKTVTGDFNGVSSSYVDAIGMQVANFTNAMLAANFNSDGYELLIDIGSLEPLLTLA